MERLKQLLEFVQRRKKLIGFFGIIVVVVVAVTMNKVYHYSETPEFCGSCHEMDIHYDSYKASKHHNEHVENCHACHVGPGIKGYAHAKLSDGTHDSLLHSFQAYTDGEFIEIAEDSVKIINGNCYRCHSQAFTKDKTHIESVAKGKKHSGEIGDALEELVCSDCHLGEVHPHMPGDLYREYAAKKIKPTGKFEEVDCFACHKLATPETVKEWTRGLHAEKGVTCVSCHGNDHGAITEKHGHVSASLCGECHQKQFVEFRESSHLKGHPVALPDTYDEISTRSLHMDGCKDCHKMGLSYDFDRIGGSCDACHPSHEFSVEAARAYDACEKCHDGGPEHSQVNISPGSIFGKVKKMRSQGLITNDLVKCQSCHGQNKSHNFSQSYIPENIDVLLFGGHRLVQMPGVHE
ncbi:MAG: NapC/NirT family cytochrome c [Candidatus Brocadiaceae bacterium]|nr:NapC/NirT family cytochrome c [Candidatus Brocadiaceae bacterium]